MKINEVILTEEQLDELNLKGLGQGLGRAVGGVAGGAIQGVKNIWSGMKQGYQSGQDALKPDGTPATPTAPNTGGTTTAPATNTTTAPNEIGANNLLARARQGTTQDPNAPQQTAPAGGTEPAPAPAQEPTTQAPAAATAQEPAAPAEPAAMKAPEIVKGLNDIWSKATANQGSMTGSPQVQQQLIAMAKQAGLAGRKIENRKNIKPAVVEFRSKFLEMNI